MKNKFYIVFSILFCIATLFMGVGYAAINSISLDISGEMIAQVQNGIFITQVNYNEELSNNILVTDSKINSSYQTNLDSSITLTNDKDSQITYDITIYNSNDLAYAFDGIEYTVGENTYSNENITYKLTGLNESDVVNSKDDINFSITFYYKDSSKISDVQLKSLLNFKFSIASYVVDTFDYIGNYETFTVPHDGIYKIELWGASGGERNTDTNSAGKGAYVSGIINLEKNKKLVIIVGQSGYSEKTTFNAGGYNGGGYSGAYEPHISYGGGGATDIRLVNGIWNDFNGLKSRIMVAAGGGGTADANNYESCENNICITHGGSGGGLVGYSGIGTYYAQNAQNPSPGTQTSAGVSYWSEDRDGYFGHGPLKQMESWGGGSGAGYYSGATGFGKGGSGGSSFISGHNGCDAINEASIESNIIHTGQSIHYSGYQFTDTVMIDGEGYKWTTERGSLIGMPTHDGIGSMLGNTGHGYAKITFVSEFE